MNDGWNGKCLECENEHAYIGFGQIECPNQKCKNFTEKQAKLVEQELKAQEARQLQEEQNDAGPEEGPSADPQQQQDDYDDDATGLWSYWGNAVPKSLGGAPGAVGAAAIPPLPQQMPTDDDFDEEELDPDPTYNYLPDFSDIGTD